MTYAKKVVGLSLAAATVLMGVLVSALPPMVGAQTAGNGLLQVYVQVINNYGVANRAPSDFTVSVFGTNASPATFQGSQSGTQVSLGAGSYNVGITGNLLGYNPSYSQGCNATIAAGQTSLCVITMNSTQSYQTYPTPYPYPYVYPQLSCVAQVSKVGLRQNVSFEARGGVGGTYNWQIPGRSYPNVGPVFTVAFDNTGTQVVTVTNASQTATCVIEVVQGNYVPGYTYPTYPTYPTGATPGYSYGYGVSPKLTYTTYPRLPNTGVEPMTAAEAATAIVVLLGIALISAPYVRKAFVVVTR